MVRNPWRGLGGLPQEVWLIFATTLVNRAGTMVLPFLALYLTSQRGLAPERAGLALSVYGLGALVSAPIAGRLSDRIGPLKVMQWSLLLSGVLLLTLPLATSVSAVFTLVFSWAVIGEALRPASLTALADAAPAAQRKAAFALNRLAVNLGMSIGPALGGFLAASSFSVLFVIDGATSVAAALLLLGLKRQPPRSPTRDLAVAGARRRWIVKDVHFLTFLAGIILIGIVFFQIEAAVPIFLVRDLQFSMSFYGLLFLLNTLLIIALEVPLNLAMAHWSHRRALVLGAVLIAAGFGGMALVDDRAGVALTVVLWTFGEMIIFPTSSAYVADVAPVDRRGAYMGSYSMALALAFIVGPWAGTLLMERLGAQTLWTAVLACGLCAAAIFGTTKITNPR